MLSLFLNSLEPLPSYQHSGEEKENSEEVEKRVNKKMRGAAQDGTPARKGKSGFNKGLKATVKSHTQQRYWRRVFWAKDLGGGGGGTTLSHKIFDLY